MKIGLKGDQEIVVTKEMLASSAGSGLVDVFATPIMIAEIERTAYLSVLPFLEEGKVTVGTKVDVSHIAATPEGKKVFIHTELVEISENGIFLTFKTEVSDEAGLVGSGTHTRAIIDKKRFMEKLEKNIRQLADSIGKALINYLCIIYQSFLLKEKFLGREASTKCCEVLKKIVQFKI